MRRANARLRAIAQRRHVRHETREPEERRHGSVGRDREHVPDQWAAELRPQPHRVRDTGTASRSRATAGPCGAAGYIAAHATAKSVIASAKRLIDVRHCWRKSSRIAEIERAGVADTDPPDEVDDVERPADRDVVSPDADTGQQQVADGQVQDHQQHECDEEAEEPADRCALREHDVTDGLGHRLEGVPGLDDRRRAAEKRRRLWRHRRRRVRLVHP